MGGPLTSGKTNDWKVSASCNGPDPWQVTFGYHEFFVLAP